MSEGLLPSTRIALVGAGFVAVVAGPILLLFPNDTGTYFAWEIANPLTPAFMGANYLAGAGALAVAYLNRWEAARVILPSIIAFTLVQLAATFMHLDVLDWSHPVAWAWVLVYLAGPVGNGIAWALESRRARPQPPPSARVPLVGRRFFAVTTVAMLAVGVFLFTVPDTAADIWPWPLTPLTARIIGGWYIAGSALQVMLARSDRLRAALVGLAATVAVSGLQLAGAAANTDAFLGRDVATAVYLAATAALGLGATATLVAARRSPPATPATA